MAQTAQLRRIDVAENEAQRVFRLQREAYLRHPYPSYEERSENLLKLERVLVENATAIAEAINADFGHRAFEESLMAELFTSVDGIRDARKRLKKWMRPQRRHVSVLFATGSNRVIPQPKVVGVVAPWNYPLFHGRALTSICVAATGRW
jgi:coniferyl-aldehyde dehydrogenase